MKKIPGKALKPFQVEMPLACVLPDKVKDELMQIAAKKEELLKQHDISCTTQIGFWDSLLELTGSTIDWFQEVFMSDLPEELRFSKQILIKLSEAAKSGAQESREQQEKRIKDLENERVSSLRLVTDEETALNYAIDVFIEMQSNLDYYFPASLIKLPKTNSAI
jgi:hypothetical protein